MRMTMTMTMTASRPTRMRKPRMRRRTWKRRTGAEWEEAKTMAQMIEGRRWRRRDSEEAQCLTQRKEMRQQRPS